MIDMTVGITNMYVAFGLKTNDEKALKINKKKWYHEDLINDFKSFSEGYN